MKIKKYISLTLGIVGLTILFITIFPILSYEWESGRKYPILISPLAEEETEKAKFVKKDLTKSENWFPVEDKELNGDIKIKYYTLSVPKLKIDNAIVRMDNNDLSQSLVHYSGSVAPGKKGNSVIYGHSVLPTFYNPKNYMAIFSTLYKLDIGDEVYITYEDIGYTFVVDSMFEVLPTDIEVLEQNTNSPYITLITCTPPGDPRKPRRLIVRAKLNS